MKQQSLTRSRPIRLLLAAALLVATPTSGALGQGAPITLRMKFRTGNVTKYRMVMDMNMAMNMSGQPKPMHVAMRMTATMRQKILKVLPDGSAEVKASTSGFKTVLNGQPFKAPTVANVGPITMTIDPLGRPKNMQSQDKTISPMLSNMFGGSGGATMPDMLPDHPVKVGDTWSGSFPLPMLGGTATYQYTLLAVETVGGIRTARIRFGVNMPLNTAASTGPGAIGGSMPGVGMTGTMAGSGILRFAVSSGKLESMSGSAHMSPTLTPGKDQQGSGQLQGSMNMKMDMSMSLRVIH